MIPRILYTEYAMLVGLELSNANLPDVSSPLSFPWLQNLGLRNLEYPSDEFVGRFLSGCTVLERLIVDPCAGDNVTVFTIRVPSLKTLWIAKSQDRDINGADGTVINAPSLLWLYLCDLRGGFCVIENGLPVIQKATLDVAYSCVTKIMGSITSVKDLSLCLKYSKDIYPVATVFHCLKRFSVWSSEPEFLNVLMSVIRDSPNLKSLRLKTGDPRGDEPRACWNEPSSIPNCLLSSLETLEWVRYEGAEEDKALVAFVLRNESCLKKVSISSKSTDRDKQLEMIKELSFFPRRSPTCHLIFH